MKEKIICKSYCTVFLFFPVLLLLSNLIPMEVYAAKPTKGELADAIADETSARQEADTILQDAIDAETIAREAGDQALQDAIDDEALARGAEDTTLQGAIDAGVSERKELLRNIRFLIPPSDSFDLNPLNCIVSTAWVCVNINGNPTLICPLPGPCDLNDPNRSPNPLLCPADCEAQGDVVVPDLAMDPCNSELAVYIGFVCMSREVYDSRGSCPEGTVQNYYSNRNGWFCDPLIPPVVHVATDVYDLVGTISLFERARTDLIAEDLQSQINDNKNLCVCPGVFTPVCGDNNLTYVNDCEAQCANQFNTQSGVCNGQ